MPEVFDFGQGNQTNQGRAGAQWDSSYQEPTNWRGLAYAPWPLRAIGGFVDYIAPWLIASWLASHIGGDAIGGIGVIALTAFFVFNLIIAQGLSGRTFGKFFTGTRCCA